MVVVMRRMYIPSLMDTYAEMVFVLFGPENFASLYETRGGAVVEEEEENKDEEEEEKDEDEESEEDEENKKDNGEGLKKAFETLEKEFHFPNILRDIVDTLHSSANVL